LLTSDLVIVCWECDPTDGKRWYACSTCSYWSIRKSFFFSDFFSSMGLWA
jgi:hypothetical protein